jgi:protoporphyrinogen IX oxidase
MAVTYLFIKSLHVVAIVTWVGGMIAAILMAASRQVAAPAQDRPRDPLHSLEVVRRWDRYVTTPAMIFAWGLGMTMAVQGGWLGSRWLTIKLVIAVILSALHGLVSGALRRTGFDTPRPVASILRYAAPATIACVAIVSFLVIAKPF